jgi:hypothetical protein
MVKKALLQKSNNKYQIDFDVYGEFAEKKTKEELVLLTKAVRISAMGQREK